MALRIGDLTEATSFVGTDVIELSLAGSAGSRRVTGSNLRKQLFAGGTGFTSTDPINAGAASFTTISGTTGTFSSRVDSEVWRGIAGVGNMTIENNAGTALVTIAKSNGATTFLNNVTAVNLLGTGTAHTLGSNAGAGIAVSINSAAGNGRDIIWQSAGVPRWIMRITSTAESGANAGSNWELLARDDAGNHIATVFSVIRATGAVTLGAGITATTGAFSGAISCTNLTAGAANTIEWSGRSGLTSSADGIINLFNNAQSGFTRLNFGGTTAGFPSLVRSGVSLHVKLADNSALTSLEVAGLTAATGSYTSTITQTGGPDLAMQFVAAASGTFGAAKYFSWYRANGTTRKAYMGFAVGDDDDLHIVNEEAAGQIFIKTNATTAITVAANQATTFAAAATFSSTVGVTGLVTANGGLTVASGQTLTLTGVTVTGFSPTITAKAVRARLSANQSITTATNTKLNWDTELFDTDTFHDNVTNNTRLTVPVSGKYRIDVNVKWAGNATGSRTVRIQYSNGGVNVMDLENSPGNASNYSQAGSAVINMSSSEYVEIEVVQSSGGNLNVLGGAEGSTSVSMTYIGA